MKKSNPIGMLRIAKITYDHTPLETDDKRGTKSIGMLIDERLHQLAEERTLVNEVTLYFETQEQQQQLMDLYLPQV